VIIYSVEAHPRYWPLLRTLRAQVQAAQAASFSSDLALPECLVHPMKAGDVQRVQSSDAFFVQPGFNPLPITREVLRLAAQLRAETPRLRTPDAIHAATALTAGANVFITNDHAFRGTRGLDVRLLDDLLPTAP
jgi:predicted nucleic acid-binding protein